MTSDVSSPPGNDFGSRDLARSVADDLGPIFAACGPRASAEPAQRSSVRALGPGPRRRRLSIASLGAVIAAGLAGLSIGGVVSHRTAPVRPPAAGPIIPALSIAIPPPAALGGMAAADPMQPGPQSLSASGPQVEKMAQRRRAHGRGARSAVSRGAGACGGLGREARAWCSHRALMDADARLRRAYGAALRAGVARPVLISYRARWARLRDQAGSEPEAAVAGYRAMASNLSHMAAHRGGPRAKHHRWFWG